MLYRILADAVVVLHFLFILFVVLGGLLAFKWRWMPTLHLPAVLWGILIEWIGWTCPLTPLENSLRETGGSSGFEGGFVENYLLPIIYPAELTRTLQWCLGLLVLTVNIVVYVLVWRRHRRHQTDSSEA